MPEHDFIPKDIIRTNTSVRASGTKRLFVLSIISITLLGSVGGAFALATDIGRGPPQQLAAASAPADGFMQWISETFSSLFGRKSEQLPATVWDDIESGAEVSESDMPETALPSMAQQASQSPPPLPQPPPSARATQPIQQTVVNQPVIERVIETMRTVVAGGLTSADLDTRLSAFETSVNQRLSSVASSASTQNAATYHVVSQTNRIDSLSDVDIDNPTITGGSITGASISGTISAAIDTASALIDSLTSTTLTATNSTTTNATTTNLAVTGTATIGSGTGILQAASGIVSAITNGSSGQVLKIVGGTPTWSTDLSGGGGASAWATTSNDLAIVEADVSDVVVIGAAATSTTGNILEIAGASLFRDALTSYGLVTAPRFTATSSTASVFPYASSTALTVSGTGYFGTASTSNLTISNAAGGLLKTNTSGVVSLAVAGTDYVSSITGDWTGTFDGQEGSYYSNATNLTSFGTPFFTFFSATTTDALTQGSTNRYYADSLVQSFVHGSTTIPKTYSSNTFTGSNTFSSLTLGSLSGPLDARNGVVGATTSVGVLYGGTGATTASGARANLAAAASGANSDITSLLALTNASTSLLSILDTLYVGRTATTTIRGDGAASVLPYASTTMVTAATASTTALVISGIADCTQALETNATGQVICGTDATGSGGASFGQAWEIGGNGFAGFLAPTTTQKVWIGQASSTLLSAHNAYFGSTATSTFSSTGFLTLPSGFLSQASSTIGSGAQAGGLTISGGATTTGNAYFAGNVGIGDASPSQLLDVDGTNPQGLFEESTTEFLRAGVGETSNQSVIGWDDSDSLQLGVYDSPTDTTIASLMTILSTGLVGIGTTSPYAKLSVVGEVVATNFTATSSAATSTFTNFVSTGNASTTNLIVSGAGGTAGCAQFSAIGLISNTGTACGSGGGSDFTFPTVNGAIAAATSSPLAVFNAAYFGQTGTTTITADGRLGIGTTSPWAKLSVNQFNGGTVPLFVVASSTGSGATSTALIVNHLGNVGIGTSSPDTALHVSGTATLDNAGQGVTWVNFTGGGESFWDFEGTDTEFLINESNVAARLTIKQGGNVGIGTTSPVTALHVVGTLALSDSANTNTHGAIFADADGLNIYGTNYADTDARNVLINPFGGNVGIGTTSPVSALNIYGDTLFNGTDRYANFGTTTGSGGYGFRDNAGTLEFKSFGGSWRSVTTATSGPSFSVHKNGSNQTVTTNVFTLLTWSTENFDTNNNFDLSTERFTPTVSGKYVISLNTLGDAANSICSPQIYKNGSRYQAGPGGGGFADGEETTIIDMNGSSDYVEGFVLCSFGTTVFGSAASTSFSGALVAPTAAVSGVWSISDQRLKENIATTSSGLDVLAHIPVYDFNLIGDVDHRQQGFIAQELYKYYPDAVVVGDDDVFLDPWLVDYGRLTPLLARAIQEIAGITGTFKANFTAWLADAANGITDFFARRGHFQEQLCVGDTCVTPEQFAEVFGNQSEGQSAAAGASESGVAPEATGDSPATGNPTVDDATLPPTDDTPTTTITSPANDNDPPTGDAAEEQAEDQQSTEETPAPEPPAVVAEEEPSAPAPEPPPPISEPAAEPANDNTPPPTAEAI